MFPSTNIVIVFTSKENRSYRSYRVVFLYVFYSTEFLMFFYCFAHSVVEKIYFLDVNFFSHG